MALLVDFLVEFLHQSFNPPGFPGPGHDGKLWNFGTRWQAVGGCVKKRSNMACKKNGTEKSNPKSTTFVWHLRCVWVGICGGQSNMIKSSSKLTLAAWEDRPKRVSCMHVHTYDCICVRICWSRGRKNMFALKLIPPTPILVRLFEISTFYLQDDSDYRHMSMLAGKSLTNLRYKMGKSSTF